MFKHICKFAIMLFILLDKRFLLTIINIWQVNIMRIFDIIKQKYENTVSLRMQKAEERRLEHLAQVERENARIQSIKDSAIPWDYVVELGCEYADENEDVCYIEKCVVCKIPRSEIWLQKEVDGVIVTGEDFGRNVKLNVSEDFYGKKQVSFWDNFDYVWYSHCKTPMLSSMPFKNIGELNVYVNNHNQKLIDNVCKDGNVKMQK